MPAHERDQPRSQQEPPSTWEEAYEREAAGPNFEGLRAELERPRATLARGGAAPSFETTSAPTTVTVQDVKTLDGQDRSLVVPVRFTPHWFHLIDAIEFDVAGVASSEQLIDVYRAYFPESALKFGQTIGSQTPFGARISLLRKMVVFNPSELDPGGIIRTTAFLVAASKKSLTDPKVSLERLTRTLIAEWDAHEKAGEEALVKRLRKHQGPCTEREVDRKGKNADHDEYAKQVTSTDKDCEIQAPGGMTCVTDGKHPFTGAVWEVKTRHEWASEAGIPSAIFAPYFHNLAAQGPGRIGDMEKQRSRCLAVTERCGFRYEYAFESEDAAKFMKVQWSNRPPVHWIKRAGGATP
jgi:hypothetical protein